MQIEIEYSTQTRTASGRSRQTLDAASECTLADALSSLVKIQPQLSPWIDAAGKPRAGLLVFVNDRAANSWDVQLHTGDVVALMTLVSGG